MSHIPKGDYHAYQRRAEDLRVDVTIDDNDVEDFSNIAFQFSDVTKSVTGEAGGDGMLIDFTLTADDLDVDVDVYRWELRADVSGETRILATGRLRVDPEPTT